MVDWSSFSIGNAAGFIKGPGQLLDDVLRSSATDITIGSITYGPRSGNEGEVYFTHLDGTSINSLGLPNPGMRETLSFAALLKEKAGQANKRLRFSIAGFSPDEYGILAVAFSPYGDIEINCGCPNVWGDSGQKPIVSFDLEVFEEVLKTVHGNLRPRDPFDVKLSPYSDPRMIELVAERLRSYNIRNIITSNTFPNGVGFTGRRRSITPRYGGIGGNAMRHIALGQVSQFSEALATTSIGIIGVGGIFSGQDIISMREAGACGVQLGTAFEQYGAKIFSQVFEEASDLLG